MPDEKATRRKLLKFPEFKESAEVTAFIDHHLQLADKLLTPNLERVTPENKTEPYNVPEVKQS